jgi:hypothetical protein
MEHKRHDSQAGSKLDEGAQQCHGISASADGHANALAGTDQTMLAHVKFEQVPAKTMSRFEIEREKGRNIVGLGT